MHMHRCCTLILKIVQFSDFKFWSLLACSQRTYVKSSRYIEWEKMLWIVFSGIICYVIYLSLSGMEGINFKNLNFPGGRYYLASLPSASPIIIYLYKLRGSSWCLYEGPSDFSCEYEFKVFFFFFMAVRLQNNLKFL